MFKFKRPARTALKPLEKRKYASNRRFSDLEVKQIRQLYQNGATKANLARLFGVVPTAITYILTEQSYSWVK